MIESASYGRAVGIVLCHAVAVVDQKAQRVSAEIAVQEDIVSAVVDTAVEVAVGTNIGKFMKFTEIRDPDPHSAKGDAHIAHHRGVL